MDVWMYEWKDDGIYGCEDLKMKCGANVQNQAPFPHRLVRATTDQGLLDSEYAGTQCTSMAATALMLSRLKELNRWISRDLNDWLILGDKYHCILREKLVVSVASDLRVGADELPDILPFLVGNKCFLAHKESEVSGNLCGAFFKDLEDATSSTFKPMEFPALGDYLPRVLSEDGPTSIILTIMGYSVALKKENKVIYLLDSHSRDDRGQPAPSGEGAAVLIEFQSVEEVTNYIIDTYKCLTDGAQYTAVRFSFDESDLATIQTVAGAINENFNIENIHELQLIEGSTLQVLEENDQ
ncbi:hypothetical protein KUTeg_017884 [Tegillarca granosa]|uniref:Uncharacterized protein n=1 Tax=Tegillarca granosa TaxID=220873 RepID=A0ABQ9EK89_TEGGR|nr:hypothetical protein KUTeg_017884 [Tegillarca granosa]